MPREPLSSDTTVIVASSGAVPPAPVGVDCLPDSDARFAQASHGFFGAVPGTLSATKNFLAVGWVLFAIGLISPVVGFSTDYPAIGLLGISAAIGIDRLAFHSHADSDSQED